MVPPVPNGPALEILGLNHRNTKKIFKKFSSSEPMAQMLELWYVAVLYLSNLKEFLQEQRLYLKRETWAIVQRLLKPHQCHDLVMKTIKKHTIIS